MSVRFTPALKGLVTALVMTGVSLAVYYNNAAAGSFAQYLLYAAYGLGVIWTLVAYRRSEAFTGKFADLFAQGFRCFIVVVLVMVVFTYVFSKLHPEFAEESAKAYKEALLKEKAKDQTPAEIEEAAETYKKRYNTILVFGSVFGYLIIGAGVTAAASALLTRRNT